MGGQVSKIMGKIFGSREMRLLMLGLDAAGKTSMSLCHIQVALIEVQSLTCACPSYPLQAQAQLRRHDHPYCRLQRRDRNVQERQIQCMGRRRAR